MSMRSVLAPLLFAFGAAFLAAQNPESLSAQDAKADKEAAIQKRLEERKKAKEVRAKAEAEKAKAEADKAKTDDAPVKPAPTETKPSKPMDVQAVAKFIDAEINKELAASKVVASGRSTDAEFLRRASLDITGVIPSAERAEAFLYDSATDKRVKLIDELLGSSKYGQRLADIWVNQMVPTDSMNRFTTKEPLVKWMMETFNANKPWNEMAHDLITATSEQKKNGAVTYYMVNPAVDKMTDSIGKLFLGVQIQCAQCHNHPFTHWKQTEYWGLAQFFYNVSVTAQRNGKQTDVVPGVTESPRPKGKNRLPESAKSVPAKFLGGEVAKLNSSKPYRPVLADWMCTADNPFFSKSMVNRIWAQYLGRGLVNPIDDMSDENEATHPALLEGLAKEFSAGGFDLKNLIRAICLSDAYQRTSLPTTANKSDTVLYSHMAVKVLTPEQLYDSLTSVSGSQEGSRPSGKGGGPRGQANTPRDRFVAFFSGSENPKATDYEAGIPQALRLMNNGKLTAGKPSEFTKTGAQPEKVVDRLYLMTVSRKPTEAEVKRLTDYIAKASDVKTAHSDILWALLNSSEFTLNH